MIIAIVIASVIVIVIVIALAFLWFRRPAQFNPKTACSGQTDVLWSDDCQSIRETKYSKDIKTPKGPLFLSSMSGSKALGPALGANVWYRYRYVDGKTGEYGDYSPWTISPIIAGGNKLPYPYGEGPVDYRKTCNDNIVSLKVSDLDYEMITSGYYANVYRVAKSPLDSSRPTGKESQTTVGILLPSFGEKSGRITDVTGSPCDEILCNRPNC